MQGECRFTDRYVLKEGVEGSQTIVSCPRTIAALGLEVIEKLPQERNIELFNTQFGERPSEVFGGELK